MMIRRVVIKVLELGLKKNRLAEFKASFLVSFRLEGCKGGQLMG